jgi:hypothetical protein
MISTVLNNPIIIGGSGGSGTRVVAQICQNLGFYMGQLSYAFDASVFEKFFDLWTKNYLLGCDIEHLNADFNDYLIKFMNGKNPKLWGFKNTRTLFFVSYFFELFPKMKYIHVVRDGRDMPFSQNHRQQKELFDVYFERGWSQSTVYEDAARFWNIVNVSAFRLGTMLLGERYFVIRLEDLVFDKYTTLTELLKFLDVVGYEENLVRCIKNPGTFGRYKNHPELIDMITNLMKEGLNEFGYEV